MHSQAHPAAFNARVRSCAHLTALHSVHRPKHAHTAAFSVHTQPWTPSHTRCMPAHCCLEGAEHWSRARGGTHHSRLPSCLPHPASCPNLLTSCKDTSAGVPLEGTGHQPRCHRAPAAHGAGASLPALAQGHSRFASATMEQGAWAANPLAQPGHRQGMGHLVTMPGAPEPCDTAKLGGARSAPWQGMSAPNPSRGLLPG